MNGTDSTLESVNWRLITYILAIPVLLFYGKDNKPLPVQFSLQT